MSRPLLWPAAALAALAALFAALFGALPSRSPRPDAARGVPHLAGTELRPGAALERLLRPGETHTFLLALSPGDYLHAVVDQRGTDVVATFRDPAGREVLVVDGPGGGEGAERVVAVSETGGRHRLEVRLFGAAAGRYAVRLLEVRPARPRDRQEAAAARAFSRAERWRAEGSASSLERALGAYQEALRGWRELGDREREASALRGLGLVSTTLGRLRDAAGWYEAALALCRRLGDVGGEIRLSNDAGVTWRLLGHPVKAKSFYDNALRLSRARGDRVNEATALFNLGVVSDNDPQEALSAYDTALAASRELGDRPLEATILFRLGVIYTDLGRFPAALDSLDRALALRDELKDLRGKAVTLNAIAWVHHLAGEPGKALPLYREALRLRHATGDLRGEASTLDRRGTTFAKAGRLDEAFRDYSRALRISRQIEDRTSEAHTLANLGQLSLARGDASRAIALQETALRVFREVGERRGAIEVLLGIATAERRLGRLHRARSRVEEALALVETIRDDAPGPDLRSSYLAFHRDDYELSIDLLMELAAREPGQGFAARAFAISERARARSLLETLAHPRSRELPRPVGLREVQELLDRDTLLLEYALGEPRSYVWAVRPDGVTGHALPGKAAIEARARQVAELLPKSAGKSLRLQADLAAAELAALLLQPVLGDLGVRRLVIVADGALLAVPFAALPVPGRDGPEPLLANHEIVALPSASVLAWLRRQRAARRPAPHSLAVIADPVFSPDDPRLRGPDVAPTSGNALTRTADHGGLMRLPRLPHARREAQTILRLVPPHESFLALDFAASRETVLSGRLARYRILHFATHGIVDAEHPELTGILLAQVDAQGRPREGLLRAHEIEALDLPADLVVLSACRTALGQEVRGEGIVGLTYGFLRAGAACVLVSLWSVDDEATAELMVRFYRGLLEEGLPPDRALREAQLSLRADPRWRSPSYWAPFTLQGDWR